MKTNHFVIFGLSFTMTSVAAMAKEPAQKVFFTYDTPVVEKNTVTYPNLMAVDGKGKSFRLQADDRNAYRICRALGNFDFFAYGTASDDVSLPIISISKSAHIAEIRQSAEDRFITGFSCFVEKE